MTRVSPGVGEAARSMLAVIDGSTGPDVQGLAGRLVLVTEAVNEHRMDEAIAEANTNANKQLVVGAVALLPDWVDDRFVGAESLLAATVAGAEMLWHSVDPPKSHEQAMAEAANPLGPMIQPRLPKTGKGTFVPYFAIGARDSTWPLRGRALQRIPTTELLLHSVASGSDYNPLKLINVPNEELDAAFSLGLERLEAELTVEDVEAMIDRATGAYRLTPGRGTDTTAFRTMPRSRLRRYVGDTLNGVRIKGMHAEPFWAPNALTDEVMEAYGVYGRLGKLAAAFGKTAEMDALLAEYDQQRATPGEGIVFTTPGK